MATPSIPDAHRCRYQIRRPGEATFVECNDVGNWVLDTDRKTWRPANPGDRKRRCWHHGPATAPRPIGRGRKQDQPNERMQRYAALVLGLAPEVTKALREINDELSLLGFPSSGSGGSSGNLDPVGEDASRIAMLTGWREDLRDWIGDLEDRISSGITLITRIRRLPPAAMGAKLCVDGQQDRTGSIAWGDPTCTDLPVRDGLCAACWKREYRWLRDHDLPTRERPVA